MPTAKFSEMYNIEEYRAGCGWEDLGPGPSALEGGAADFALDMQPDHAAAMFPAAFLYLCPPIRR